VEIAGDQIRLCFRGKHGIVQDLRIRSRLLARLLRQMKRLPGRELLKFQNGEGQVCDLRRRHLNEYIKRTMGGRFSARDFRTWAATLLCAAALRREGETPGPARAKAIVRAVRETASHLGNTPAVVRGSYVHPLLLAAFRHGRVVRWGLARPESLLAHRRGGLDRSERALLALLRAEGARHDGRRTTTRARGRRGRGPAQSPLPRR
jgi:DNA topoisomerase-1